MNSILMPFRPEWACKILNREKTIEIRKTIPACLKNGEPVEVWMYCTKKGARTWRGSGKPINGLVVCKFVVEKADEIVNAGCRFEIAYSTQAETEAVAKASCLDFKDLQSYLGKKDGKALHITSLEVFDKPKKLGDFHKTSSKVVKGNPNGKGLERSAKRVYTHEPITKAPSSWCYVIPPIADRATPEGEKK